MNTNHTPLTITSSATTKSHAARLVPTETFSAIEKMVPDAHAMTTSELIKALTAVAKGAIEKSRNDRLTGLPNRGALYDDWASHLSAQDGYEGYVSVVVSVVDINGLKTINDTKGHAAGDALIIDFAARLDTLAKDANGTAYRVGGDEFVIVSQFHPGTIDGASLGSSVHLGTGSLDDAIANADATMYAAKAAHYAATNPTARRGARAA